MLKVSCTVRKVTIFSRRVRLRGTKFFEEGRGELTERRHGLSEYMGRDHGCIQRGGGITEYRRGVQGREGSCLRGLDHEVASRCSVITMRSVSVGTVNRYLRFKGDMRSGKCKVFQGVLSCGLT